MTMNLGLVRQDTPGCKDLVHFNNAGSSLQPRAVTEAVLHHLMLEQRLGGYEAAEAQAALSDNFYHALARLFNCAPREIAFAENSTRAWTQLLLAIPFESGDRILTGQSEYASNYLSLLHLAKTRGVRIDVVPNLDNGKICLQTLEKKLDDDVRLIALTHVASQSGVIQPVAEVGKLARKHRIFYLLDACQSAGQLQLDVNEIGCDMLTGSGRKYMRGPRGTGFMYVRHTILNYLQPQSIDLQSATWASRDHYELRDDARRFEVWEHYVAGKIGLAVAADYAFTMGMDEIENTVRSLADRLRHQIAELPGFTVHESGAELCGIVTFSSEHHSAMQIQQHLRTQHINTSVIRRQNTQLDFATRQLGDIGRASVHYYNTDTEIEQFCSALRLLTHAR
ncbi:MAG: aminotransferase class V-fold PLP-dependent enzyme [Pseudohongiella sp.]|nr:aminotransferase class V-fold PLP-dependent enzyme [Pseudohongiella sp.]MDO9518638.1 aminotransferase class V-fold PLP-dependent enzyme [Pseudohongiella sp.]